MSANTLYLHIGLPKTASTYLQNLVFPRLDHLLYLNTPRSTKFSDPDAKYGHRVMVWCLARSAFVWSEYGDKVLEELLGRDRHTQRLMRRDVLISEEGIGRAGSRPLFLREHLERLAIKASDWGFDSLKIFCSFRRQDYWLASHFAQTSNRIRNASQREFELSVAQILDPQKGRYMLGMLLDYTSLREQLVAAVGESNLLMLPHELLVDEPSSYQTQLFTFLGANSGLVRTFSSASESAGAKQNVRSVSETDWALADRFESTIPLRLRPHRVFAACGLPSMIRIRIPELARARSIKITPLITEKVLGVYSESNQQLEAALGINLRKYGYF